VKPRQWAGLAAIACSLRAEAGVSVEVLELSPKEKLFDRFCRTLRRKG